MKNETPYWHTQGAQRVLPPRTAPKGAVIMCSFLVGMTGIAAGAYAMRDRIFSAPAVSSEIEISLPRPAVETGPRLSTDAMKTDARPDAAPMPPRLAALTPSGTRLRDGLASPLSRIFVGRPAAVPPPRPGTEPIATETGGPARIAALRPRARPAGLAASIPAEQPAAQIENIQLASLAAPEETARTAAEAPLAATRLPATPPIARGNANCPRQLANAMPRRKGGAASAQAVLASVQGLDGVKRDSVVEREILRGNMPGFLHNLVPVSVSGPAGDGRQVEIVLCVTPDYLAVGDDRDYVRVPLGLRAATGIGDAFNMILPTPRMVDLIYRAAALRLPPQPMPPGPQMTSTAYFTRHNATVEAQLRRAGAVPGTLVSGQKKDVVLTTRLASNRGRVAIYGWHRTNGRPIQPLSTVHGAGYADYSHGVRLVSRTAYLNGKPMDLRELIADPRYAGLLSKEGPVGGPALRMAALAAN